MSSKRWVALLFLVWTAWALPGPPVAAITHIWPTWATVWSGIAGVRFAIEKINADPTILPDTHLELFFNSTPAYTALSTFEVWHWQLTHCNPVAAVASISSEHTLGYAYAATVAGVPLVAPTALSGKLVDEGTYFMRTTSSTNLLAEVSVALMRQFGWTNVVIFYKTDDASLDLRDKFMSHPDTVDFTIENIEFSPSDATRAIERAQLFETYLYLVFCFPTDDTRTLLQTAYRTFEDRDRIWIIPHLTNANIDGALSAGFPAAMYHGLLSVVPQEGFGELYEEFLGFLEEQRPGTVPSYIAVTSYDAVWAIAHGLHSLYSSSDENTGENLYSHMLAQSFMGLSWQVSFANNGNGQIPEGLYNYVVVGGAPVGEFRYVGVYEQGVVSLENDIVWANGLEYDQGAYIPHDAPTPCGTDYAWCMASTWDLTPFATTANGTRACDICSGLGTCVDERCLCLQASDDSNWAGLTIVSGEHCSEVVQPHQRSTLVLGISLAFSSLAAVVVVGILLIVYRFRTQPAIKASAPIFGYISGVGGLLMVLSQIVSVATFTPTVPSCGVSNVALNMGFTLMMGPLFLKNWRILLIFSSGLTNQKVIPDSVLLLQLGGLAFVDLLIAAIFSFAEAPQVVPSLRNERFMYHCEVSTTRWLLQVIYKLALLVWGVYLSLAARSIPTDIFKEANEILLAIYNLSFSAVAVLPFLLFGSRLPFEVDRLVIALAVSYMVMGTLCLVYVPKVYNEVDKSRTPSVEKERSVYSFRPKPGTASANIRRDSGLKLQNVISEQRDSSRSSSRPTVRTSRPVQQFQHEREII